MKKTSYALILAFVFTVMTSVSALAENMSNYELMQQLKETKKRLEQLENQLNQKSQGMDQGGTHSQESLSGRQGIPERVRKIEKMLKEKPFLGPWADRITLSGLVEVEASYESKDYADSTKEDEDSSDLDLAKAELGIEADIVKHVSGQVLLLYENDDDGVGVDEAFITLDGEDVLPLYLNAGKLYVPFGNYESHFISDPILLELGETREGAVTAGFANDVLDFSLSAFNGKVNETGEDDHINGFVGSAMLTLPEGTIPEFGLTAGASYISNIADSGGLSGELATADEVQDYVGGLGGFLSASFQGRFFFEAEYISALDNFQAGELNFDGGKALEPKAWNFEFAFIPLEKLELAARYEGGEDLGDFQPETRYGVAATYSLFENTSLAVEYLRGEFENDDKSNVLTAQLGIEF